MRHLFQEMRAIGQEAAHLQAESAPSVVALSCYITTNTKEPSAQADDSFYA